MGEKRTTLRVNLVIQLKISVVIGGLHRLNNGRFGKYKETRRFIVILKSSIPWLKLRYQWSFSTYFVWHIHIETFNQRQFRCHFVYILQIVHYKHYKYSYTTVQ
jgi:hypothetical protein